MSTQMRNGHATRKRARKVRCALFFLLFDHSHKAINLLAPLKKHALQRDLSRTKKAKSLTFCQLKFTLSLRLILL